MFFLHQAVVAHVDNSKQPYIYSSFIFVLQNNLLVNENN